MLQSEEYIRIIFGLKIKKLREEHAVSLKEVSSKTGISISYLNEIENGKKYPNPQKVARLAEYFDVNYDQLVALKVTKDLAPIANYLNMDVVNDDLLATFGIDKSALLSILLNNPLKVSAFINAGMEIASSYNLKQEHFYFLCLRAYQELNENYFEEIEEAVDVFRKAHFGQTAADISSTVYQHFLEKEFNYTIQKTDFTNYPSLYSFRSVFIPEKKLLLYNEKLTEQQKVFLFGREIGFEVLDLKKRPYTTSWLKVESFDHVINNFKASYFAQALHLNRESIVKDLEHFFSLQKFKAVFIHQLLAKYNASPEMLLTRFTNLLTKYFNINEVFFIRYSNKEAEKNLKEISKEMHLLKHTSNREYASSEQKFRREITRVVVRYLSEEADTKEREKVAAFISQSPNGNEYFTLSALTPMPELNNNNNSVTIGFVLTESVKKKIKFIQDAKFQSTELQQYFDTKRNAMKKQRETPLRELQEEDYARLKSDVLR